MLVQGSVRGIPRSLGARCGRELVRLRRRQRRKGREGRKKGGRGRRSAASPGRGEKRVGGPGYRPHLSGKMEKSTQSF